jgi:hypothetical protein
LARCVVDAVVAPDPLELEAELALLPHPAAASANVTSRRAANGARRARRCRELPLDRLPGRW